MAARPSTPLGLAPTLAPPTLSRGVSVLPRGARVWVGPPPLWGTHVHSVLSECCSPRGTFCARPACQERPVPWAEKRPAGTRRGRGVGAGRAVLGLAGKTAKEAGRAVQGCAGRGPAPRPRPADLRGTEPQDTHAGMSEVGAVQLGRVLVELERKHGHSEASPAAHACVGPTLAAPGPGAGRDGRPAAGPARPVGPRVSGRARPLPALRVLPQGKHRPAGALRCSGCGGRRGCSQGGGVEPRAGGHPAGRTRATRRAGLTRPSPLAWGSWGASGPPDLRPAADPAPGPSPTCADGGRPPEPRTGAGARAAWPVRAECVCACAGRGAYAPAGVRRAAGAASGAAPRGRGRMCVGAGVCAGVCVGAGGTPPAAEPPGPAGRRAARHSGPESARSALA